MWDNKFVEALRLSNEFGDDKQLNWMSGGAMDSVDKDDPIYGSCILPPGLSYMIIHLYHTIITKYHLSNQPIIVPNRIIV